MKTFVVGDIHGQFKAFKNVLKVSKFNFNEDRLIILGDVYDGFTGNFKNLVNFIIKIPNHIWIRGNHDAWVLKWFTNTLNDNEEITWLTQGGYQTRSDYLIKNNKNLSLIDIHAKKLATTLLYFIDENKNLFVHGGIDWDYPIDNQPDTPDIYYWDRDTYRNAKFYPYTWYSDYKYVFVGHTATDNTTPELHNNLWNLDQGSGGYGKLTLMNIETFEYWQDNTKDKAKVITFMSDELSKI